MAVLKSCSLMLLFTRSFCFPVKFGEVSTVEGCTGAHNGMCRDDSSQVIEGVSMEECCTACTNDPTCVQWSSWNSPFGGSHCYLSDHIIPARGYLYATCVQKSHCPRCPSSPLGNQTSVASPLPALEKLVCEVAEQQFMENKATNAICSLVTAKVPVQDCQAKLEKLWDKIVSMCPKGRPEASTLEVAQQLDVSRASLVSSLSPQLSSAQVCSGDQGLCAGNVSHRVVKEHVSKEECCAACDADPKCVQWSFSFAEKVCFLSPQKTEKISDASSICSQKEALCSGDQGLCAGNVSHRVVKEHVSKEECCAACDADPKCVQWSFSFAEKVCFLSPQKTEKISDASSICSQKEAQACTIKVLKWKNLRWYTGNYFYVGTSTGLKSGDKIAVTPTMPMPIPTGTRGTEPEVFEVNYVNGDGLLYIKSKIRKTPLKMVLSGDCISPASGGGGAPPVATRKPTTPTEASPTVQDIIV